MTKKKDLARNQIWLDGLPFLKRAGAAWCDYSVAAEYLGLKNRSSVAVYIWRHNLRTITHGRRKLVRKRDLDRASGAISGEPLNVYERIPLRARRR